MSVVQFSNDVRVELSPQLMPMDQLRAQLGEMVSQLIAASSSYIFSVIRLKSVNVLPKEAVLQSAAKQQCCWHTSGICTALLAYPDHLSVGSSVSHCCAQKACTWPSK